MLKDEKTEVGEARVPIFSLPSEEMDVREPMPERVEDRWREVRPHM